MAFSDGPEMRILIRDRLIVYMSDCSKSAEVIARDIHANRADIAPDEPPDRAPIDHGVITRFLKSPTRTHRAKVEILYRLLVFVRCISDPTIQFRNRPRTDPIFQLIEQFFGLSAGNLRSCQNMRGEYTLYFRSEDLDNHVVQAAIRFESNEAGDAFKVTEHQENRRSQSVEDWTGYYIARKDFIIVFLRGEGPLESVPKVYFLYPPQSNAARKATETRGIMLKIGTRMPIYLVTVSLRRDDQAFTKCDVLPNRQVSAILGDIPPIDY
jgi:hypothetical protein